MLTGKFNAQMIPKKKNHVRRITTEKISKTLVALNDDFKARIDKIFLPLHQNSVYLRFINLNYHTKTQFWKVLVIYLKSNMHFFPCTFDLPYTIVY